MVLLAHGIGLSHGLIVSCCVLYGVLLHCLEYMLFGDSCSIVPISLFTLDLIAFALKTSFEVEIVDIAKS